MVNYLKKSLTSFISAICTQMAFTVSASACNWSSFQPEEPKCLRNKE
ncbi:hypothetical protein CLPUN_44270 [Clostridium puniceum]|uniref:Cyclic lactone autoinducer peptide n=1 Tax=Clostridium puniceum TaxID=29367 RepID=A0A1S8T7F2_9CLOT|nr:cyclic lactone autoinducer peptide [Clostridium puniceum]OOM73673.1 hypothetical protein CLPUN_44270 [Clostridium puniceum]